VNPRRHLGSARAGHELDVLMLGPYPPPLGGMSLYVQRLLRQLVARGLRVAVLNHFRSSLESPEVIGTLARNPMRYWWALRRTRSRVVHYHHSSRTSALVAVALVSRRDSRTFVVTLHGPLRALRSRLPLVRRLTGWSLRRFDSVVAVSAEVAEQIAEIVAPERVAVLPAFLPPDRAETDGVTLDEEAARFIADGEPTVVMSAYKVAGRPSDDLWGLDIAVDAFTRVAARHPRLRLAAFVAFSPRGGRSQAYLGSLRKRIRNNGLEDRFLIRFGAPLLAGLGSNTIYIRPTRSDGDAVSLREALALGVPAIATDVVRRPDGVLTSPGVDPDALAAVLERVIAGEPADCPVAAPDTDERVNTMVAVYGLAGQRVQHLSERELSR
jgi:glycosyltransferase involved in cell wall biosynthesis